MSNNTQLATAAKPSALALMATLDYDGEDGFFRWKHTMGPRAKAGAKAGSLNDEGYVVIRSGKTVIKAHRLAWIFTYGISPEQTIDHINGIRSDNRLINLRLATKMENSRNGKMRRTNKSGHKGVCWHMREKKWRSQICVNYKVIHLGSYNDIDAAKEAYEQASIKHFGEFSRIN